MPQDMPSLRLLTSPAWQVAERLRSRQVVSLKTSPNERWGGGGPGAAAICEISTPTCPWLSLTKSAERRSPSTATTPP